MARKKKVSKEELAARAKAHGWHTFKDKAPRRGSYVYVYCIRTVDTLGIIDHCTPCIFDDFGELIPMCKPHKIWLENAIAWRDLDNDFYEVQALVDIVKR